MEPQFYDKLPPRIAVLEVTRENYKEIASYLEADTVEIKTRVDVPGYLRVRITFPSGRNDLEFAWPASSPQRPENYPRQFIQRNEFEDFWEKLNEYDLKTHWTPSTKEEN